MHRLWIVSSLTLSLSAFACGKDDAGSGGGGKSETVSLAKLGLKAEVPGGSNVSDAIIGDGVMIQGPDLVVTVELASDSTPKTAAEAKEEASMYSPKKLETEDLSDGWALTFENTGGMGTNYFVNVRREIGGKAYYCTTTASKPAQQKNALAACKSLAL